MVSRTASRNFPIFDLIVIGGGINGVGIARDAAGRGLKVLLCEKGDLAEGTSSRSGKFIHGGLRYLEYYEFRLVREALKEREVILSMAPHITLPMRLVLPHSPKQRPLWLIRLGLFLYDYLGGHCRLPRSSMVDLKNDAEGRMIRDDYRKGFSYSDVWVDDARLVALNAVDARIRGATVLTRTSFQSAKRGLDTWEVGLKNHLTEELYQLKARAIVNASGAWVESVMGRIKQIISRRKVRLVKGSHIIIEKWWDGGHGYVLQNHDKRIIFVYPYLKKFALVGTTDIAFQGKIERVAIDEDEIDYLLAALGRYFKVKFNKKMILDSFSGIRPLFDDDNEDVSAVTRDYKIELDTREDHRLPVLSVFGGKITTYRKLSEQVLKKLKPFFGDMQKKWTHNSVLPGGVKDRKFEGWFDDFFNRYLWLGEELADHYARCYGSRSDQLLEGAHSIECLGNHFGHLFYEREAVWLYREEWAITVEDILTRRTKHGLFLNRSEKKYFKDWLEKFKCSQVI